MTGRLQQQQRSFYNNNSIQLLIITDNQGSGVKVFIYFYRLTKNLTECYRSVCQFITRIIMKFENTFFCFFQQFLKKCLFPVFLIIFAYLTSFFIRFYSFLLQSRF
jgi:hypothetical protein